MYLTKVEDVLSFNLIEADMLCINARGFPMLYIETVTNYVSVVFNSGFYIC